MSEITGLEFATTEEIIDELKKRHDAALIALYQDVDQQREATTFQWWGSTIFALGLVEDFRWKLLLHRQEPIERGEMNGS